MPRVKISASVVSGTKEANEFFASKSEEWGVYLGIPCRRKKKGREGVRMRVGVTQRQRERGASYQSGGGGGERQKKRGKIQWDTERNSSRKCCASALREREGATAYCHVVASFRPDHHAVRFLLVECMLTWGWFKRSHESKLPHFIAVIFRHNCTGAVPNFESKVRNHRSSPLLLCFSLLTKYAATLRAFRAENMWRSDWRKPLGTLFKIRPIMQDHYL